MDSTMLLRTQLALYNTRHNNRLGIHYYPGQYSM